jgi:hypothetical protein
VFLILSLILKNYAGTAGAFTAFIIRFKIDHFVCAFSSVGTGIFGVGISVIAAFHFATDFINTKTASAC